MQKEHYLSVAVDSSFRALKIFAAISILAWFSFTKFRITCKCKRSFLTYMFHGSQIQHSNDIVYWTLTCHEAKLHLEKLIALLWSSWEGPLYFSINPSLSATSITSIRFSIVTGHLSNASIISLIGPWISNFSQM